VRFNPSREAPFEMLWTFPWAGDNCQSVAPMPQTVSNGLIIGATNQDAAASSNAVTQITRDSPASEFITGTFAARTGIFRKRTGTVRFEVSTSSLLTYLFGGPNFGKTLHERNTLNGFLVSLYTINETPSEVAPVSTASIDGTYSADTLSGFVAGASPYVFAVFDGSAKGVSDGNTLVKQRGGSFPKGIIPVIGRNTGTISPVAVRKFSSVFKRAAFSETLITAWAPDHIPMSGFLPSGGNQLYLEAYQTQTIEVDVSSKVGSKPFFFQIGYGFEYQTIGDLINTTMELTITNL
jgi:hypothetical protein